MMHLHVVLLSGLVLAACAADVVGQGPGKSDVPDPGTPTPDAGASDAGPAVPPPDAGDADADADAADPIFGSDPMTYVEPGSSDSPAHGGSVQGRPCLESGCHSSTDTRPFVFAGTVFEEVEAGGHRGVARAEVRVTAPTGEFGRAYTDPRGNFWLEKDEALPHYARAGVRRETGPAVVMTGYLVSVAGFPEGDCNSSGCHGAAQPGRIVVPK